ncbi:uncharacterized protein [Clytia hemisphaerica]|uniref:uncharacterized protein n=1 Tax=Clytia hemisphaerica TaxID=252671 RepID=UPI0034D68199
MQADGVFQLFRCRIFLSTCLYFNLAFVELTDDIRLGDSFGRIYDAVYDRLSSVAMLWEFEVPTRNQKESNVVMEMNQKHLWNIQHLIPERVDKTLFVSKYCSR